MYHKWTKIKQQAQYWTNYWHGINPRNEAIAKRMVALAEDKLSKLHEHTETNRSASKNNQEM